MAHESRLDVSRRRTWPAVAWLLAIAAIVASPAPGQAGSMQELESKVQEFTLDNGLRFLILEDHSAPVFSYATCVDAGGVCEKTGITGIAHMFEHMAFKGTTTIGTTDYKKEQKAFDRIDEAWDAVLAERAKRFDADSTRLAELEAEFKAAIEDAQPYVVPNEFSRVLETNGVRGLNAFTGTDITCYIYSLPSNRLELWARMEGDRLTQPALREFYKERDVVRNERRIGTESTPSGRLFEAALTTAFMAHPYGNGVIGHSSDIENFHRRDAWEFFNTYYVASNMTVCLVGDVTVDDVKKYAKKYFSGVRAGEDPPPIHTTEPVHTAERRVLMEEDANPIAIIGYQSPASVDPDYAAMELLMEVLGGGRSSRLYERLVKEEQVATQLFAGTGMPGEKYENLAVVYCMMAADRDPLEAERIIYEEIDRLIAEGPTPEEVEKVKAGYKARMLRQLREPGRLAVALASADQREGDWRYPFRQLDRIDAVTAEEMQRMAAERLVKERRTVAMIVPEPEVES